MSDEKALLSAIASHPDEDTPRLAYADWVEEHVDPGYAAFIRHQCNISGKLPWQDDSYLTTQATIQNLLQTRDANGQTNEEQWAADFRFTNETPPQERFSNPVFHRGLIEKATFTAGQFIEHYASVRAQQPLDDVTIIINSDEQAQDLANCEALRGIRRLTLRSDKEAALTNNARFANVVLNSKHLQPLLALDISAFPCGDFTAITGLQTRNAKLRTSTSQLQELHINTTRNDAPGAPTIIQQLATLPCADHLTSVGIVGPTANPHSYPAHTPHFERGPEAFLNKLQTLELTTHNLLVEDFGALRSQCKSLQTLKLNDCMVNGISRLFAVNTITDSEKNLQHLHTLKLESCGLGDQGLRDFFDQPAPSALRNFAMRRMSLGMQDTHHGIRRFSSLTHWTGLNQLHTLDVSNNPMTLQFSAYLIAPNLRQLNMSRCELRDTDAKIISQSGLPQLETLDVSGNLFEGTATKQILNPENLPKLHHLQLQGNSQITPEALAFTTETRAVSSKLGCVMMPGQLNAEQRNSLAELFGGKVVYGPVA